MGAPKSSLGDFGLRLNAFAGLQMARLFTKSDVRFCIQSEAVSALKIVRRSSFKPIELGGGTRNMPISGRQHFQHMFTLTWGACPCR